MKYKYKKNLKLAEIEKPVIENEGNVAESRQRQSTIRTHPTGIPFPVVGHQMPPPPLYAAAGMNIASANRKAAGEYAEGGVRSFTEWHTFLSGARNLCTDHVRGKNQ